MTIQRTALRNGGVVLALAMLSACSAARSPQAAEPDRACTGCSEVLAAETLYGELNDASSIIGAIDSGLFSEYLGLNRADWNSRFKALQMQLAAKLAVLPRRSLPASEARVLGILRDKLDSFDDEPSSGGSSSGQCADAARKELAFAPLSSALEGCFTEFANALEFEGARLDRVTALGKLSDLGEPARRKALFLAFVPLWKALNGENEPDSPYRRLIALAASDTRTPKPTATGADRSTGTPIDAAARTAGVNGDVLEQWLIRILETWGEATRGRSVEPWDYRYAGGSAERELAGRIALGELLKIDHRYYRDLGVDLDALGVLYDLSPRPDKSSVAYTDFLLHGHWKSGTWHPTIARVLATYREGNLGSLNELVHENGHAAQLSAIRNRPAYVDWNDDLFVEAFADVSSWSLYEPAWQRKYIGAAASETDSLRALFGGVMLDVAWALFETRMLRAPDSDPNALWTQITSQYLHIVPHPELSWWAVRVQLVESPGYMVNYGLGAVLTADLRQRVRSAIGDFDTGNAQWYPWLSQHLLRYGSQQSTPDLIRNFLGRPLSPDALLAQIGRMQPNRL